MNTGHRLILNAFGLIGISLWLGACAGLGPRPAPPLSATQTPGPTASLAPALTRTSVPSSTPTPEPTLAPTYPPRLRSGARIVYVDSQRNLWVWDEGQDPLLLANSEDVDRAKISPDGERIILTRAANGIKESIWVVNANGSDGRMLMQESKLWSISPVENAYTVVPFQMRWISGTNKMALSSRPIFDGMRSELNYDLMTLDTDTADIQQLFAQKQAGLFFLSPDGKQIALAHPGRLDLIDSDGRNLRKGALTFPDRYAGQPYSVYPRWAQDGSRLRVVVPPVQAGANAPIWDVPASGEGAVQVGSVSAEALYTATFSPDLSGLIYLRQAGGDAPEAFREVHVANGDGSADRSLVTGQVSIDEWSPDSTLFIYGYGMPSTPMVAAKAGEGSPLTDRKRAEQIRWLDGQHVVFFVREGQTWELRMGRPGEESRLLISFPHVKARPSFDFVP